MKALFFDTETTGLPKNYKADIREIDNWPRLVQLGFQFFDDGKLKYEFCETIKPEGYIIPGEVTNVHGISTEMAVSEGCILGDVLKIFDGFAAHADIIIGHNISFDRKIIGAEHMRTHGNDILHGLPRFCTMWSTRNFCKLSGKRKGFKIPSLKELYKITFGTDMEGAHNALKDVQATSQCYYELRRRGVITYQTIYNELVKVWDNESKKYIIPESASKVTEEYKVKYVRGV